MLVAIWGKGDLDLMVIQKKFDLIYMVDQVFPFFVPHEPGSTERAVLTNSDTIVVES